MWSSGAGLFAACFIAVVPGYISRSVAGSYDNEGIAIFALMFTYYLWVSVQLHLFLLNSNHRQKTAIVLILPTASTLKGELLYVVVEICHLEGTHTYIKALSITINFYAVSVILLLQLRFQFHFMWLQA